MKLAQTAFPGRVSADLYGVAADAFAQTATLIGNVSVPAIFEAAFVLKGSTFVPISCGVNPEIDGG